MSTEIGALATTAATTLVELMATDTWTQARAHVLRVWRRNHPEQARQLEADLHDAHRFVGVARECHAIAEEQAVREEWRVRITELLRASPRSEYELRVALNAMAHLQTRSMN